MKGSIVLCLWWLHSASDAIDSKRLACVLFCIGDAAHGYLQWVGKNVYLHVPENARFDYRFT
jgi:hypothetical protein